MSIKASRQALWIALIYIGVASLWILFSGEMLKWLVLDENVRGKLEIFKGLAYVLVTGVLLYLTIWKLQRRWEQEVERHRQTSAEMTKARQYYQKLMETSGDGIHVLNEKGELIEANAAFYRMLDYAPENPPPLKVSDWDAKWSGEQLRERIEFDLENTRRFETLHRRRDGQIIQVEVTAQGAKIDGRRCICASSRDITGRKLAEEKLRESEERYRWLFELESDGIILADLETHQILDVNPASERIYGYNRYEFLQLHLEDLSSEPELSRQSIVRNDIHVPMRWHRRKNGERFAVEITTSTFQHQGRTLKLATMRDITEQKRAEAALRENEEKFSKMFRSSPVPVTLSSLNEGRYLDVNDEFLKLVERTRDQVVGHTAVEIGVWANPAERSPVIARIKEAGFVRDFKLAVRTGSGQIRNILWSAEVVVIGEQECLLGTSLDITDRERTEEQLNVQASAMAAAANAIVITDRHGKIEWVNPAFIKLTGYTAEEAIGNNMRFLKSGQHPPAFYANIWATVLTGNVWHGEVVNRRKDGHVYTEDMTITPVRNGDGQVAHFVAVKQDVTEQRQFEKRVQQAQKMEAIGTLAGGIAHDFNNILAAMFGYAYLLQQDTEGNPTAQENIQEILKATGRAKDLVQQILTFSRQREQKPQVVRLDTIVKEAIKFLRASLPAQIKIEMNLGAETPAVLADPTQIYQVVINLATNAVHAMDDNAGKLTIALEYFLPDSKFIQSHPEFRRVPYARLTMADTGHGMDAQTLERIFEPFFTTKPVGKGTGLGLAVVHGIVQSHNGAITVKSEVGQGATFCLYFPGQKNDTAPSSATDNPVPCGGGQKILLLDDEPALTGALERLLVRLNYRVTTSNSARETVGWCEKDPRQFDLVITDLTMPEMNGLEVARQIRALRPDMPVILASGFSADLNRETLSASGICDLLEKPISRTTLADVVQRALNGRNSAVVSTNGNGHG